MSAVLLIPLSGPMQSWGTRSRFQERDTEREPSKSGVIGLLCAALGRDRSEPIDDLTSLKMGVRVDREGLLRKDFQTAQSVAVAGGGTPQNLLSNRYFLADAVFLVGLEGESTLLQKLHSALKNPIWPLFLGRKSYVPSLPLYLTYGFIPRSNLREALMQTPLLSQPEPEAKIRLIIEPAGFTHESRMDSPISFAIGKREFRERFVNTELMPMDVFAAQGGQ